MAPFHIPIVGKVCGILTSRMEYYPNLFVCTHALPESCWLGQKWETERGRSHEVLALLGHQSMY